jgi:hypothetical protein
MQPYFDPIQKKIARRPKKMKKMEDDLIFFFEKQE